MSELNGVILGWVLGLLSAPLTLYLTGVVEGRRFRAVLAVELSELRYQLVGILYVLKEHLGELDRATIELLIEELQLYPSGIERDRILKKVQAMISCSDEQLAAAAALKQDQVQKTKAMSPLSVQYLVANIPALALLNETNQRAVVSLLRNLEVINSKIADVTEWDRQSFSPSSPENYDLLVGNSKAGMKAISVAARRALDSIRGYS